MKQASRRFCRFVLVVWTLGAASLFAKVGMAQGNEPSLDQALRGLVSEEDAKVEESAARIAESNDPASALPALQALCDERLLMAPDGALFYKDDKGAFRVAATRAVASPAPEGTKVVEMNNSLRRAVLPLIARLRLVSPDTDVRLAAVNELAKRGAADGAALLRAALEQKHDSKFPAAMPMELSKVDFPLTDREHIM